MNERIIIRCFQTARQIVGKRYPHVLRYGLNFGCPDCEAAHRRHKRQFMHVGHVPGMVCCAAASARLPARNLMGMFLHEFGHVVGGPEQWDADLAIFNRFGIPIGYDEKKLQYVEVD